MSSSLNGARVGLLESRLSSELAELVRRLGGTPVLAPSVRELPHAEETARFVDRLVTERFSVVVILTGAAATAVLNEADRRGQLSEALDALGHATIVCRGPKPTAVMRRHGVHVDFIPERPYTTNELLRAIESVDLRDRAVAVLHYGERNVALTEALVGRGARLSEVCPYEWALPENTEPLRSLVRDLPSRIDAIAFTSQIQVRNLFAIAAEMGLAEETRAALNSAIIVAAVGPVCAEALKQERVLPDVQPADPKMGPLLMALADYIELTQGAHEES
jgi:uroporphyrinogen-III synthase